MRLVNIGLGEITDRLTILALKIAHGEQQGKEIDHFVKERNALLVQFRTVGAEASMSTEFVFELAAVNAMLWSAEDTLRVFRNRAPSPQLPDPKDLDAVGLVAFSIQALNDKRADLVWTLNKLAGTDLGREKLND